MKAIIIEDSRLARLELKNLLQAHPSIQIIDEAKNAEEGILKIIEHKPDLIFLDIQMPGKSGFEMLEELDEIPMVIFTTAYDEYALKSFEYSALDYLMKPIKPQRLAKAVEKVLEKQKVETEDNKNLMTGDSQVFVKDGNKCWIVKLSEIRLFEIDGNYTRIFFNENKAMIHKSLNYLEQKLDPKEFFRANRQQIINIKQIKKVEPWFNDKFKVYLKGNEKIEVSRRQASHFKELLSF